MISTVILILIKDKYWQTDFKTFGLLLMYNGHQVSFLKDPFKSCLFCTMVYNWNYLEKLKK